MYLTYIDPLVDFQRLEAKEDQIKTLIDKIYEPTITEETAQEFEFMDRQQQAWAKNADGGFLPGLFKNGKFRESHFLALNIQFPPEDFIEVCEALPFNCVVYSTHSHSPSHPHYRLLVFFDRAIWDYNRYVSLAKGFVDAYLDPKWVDAQSYYPDREVFCPTIPKDGDQWYERKVIKNKKNVDPEFLPLPNFETILLPASKDLELGTRAIYNNRFSISDVLEQELPSLYKPSDDLQYFTYRSSHNVKGLYIYKDDRHCMPLYETDPGHRFALKYGHALDPYELAMIHLFNGNQDRMDRYVIERYGNENLDWQLKLVKSKKSGRLLEEIQNYELILANDPNLAGLKGFNEMTGRYELFPGKFLGKMVSAKKPVWTDNLENRLYSHLSTNYHLKNEKLIHKAFDIVMDDKAFNPVKDVIDKVEWDGKPRMDTVFIDWLGVKDTPFTRLLSHKWFVGAIARVFDPGCQFDTMLVLLGTQGKGKTKICKKLAGECNYYMDLQTFEGKEAKEDIIGKWIVEISEMEAQNKANSSTAKSFITRTEDYFRKAYGKNPETYLRCCAFIGTTNKQEFLKDITGNRRYWPLNCGERPIKRDINTEWTEEERLQIWAEALVHYRLGEQFYLTGEEEEKLSEEQLFYTQVDDMVWEIKNYIDMTIDESFFSKIPSAREDAYKNYLTTDIPAGSEQRQFICIKEVYQVVLGNTEDRSPALSMCRRIGDCLRVLGWETTGKVASEDPYYRKQRYFYRPKVDKGIFKGM